MTDETDPRKAHWAMRQRTASSGTPAAGGPEPSRFPKFAAAMDAARVAKSPQLALYAETPPLGLAPADGGAAAWRAPGGPVVRWVGIGSCVLLFGLLTVTMLTQPIGAAIERLIGTDLEAQQEQAAFAPPPDLVPPATLEPAAGLADPPSSTRSLPVLALRDAEAPVQKSPKVTALAASGRPLGRSLPVPLFKPPAAP